MPFTDPTMSGQCGHCDYSIWRLLHGGRGARRIGRHYQPNKKHTCLADEKAISDSAGAVGKGGYCRIVNVIIEN